MTYYDLGAYTRPITTKSAGGAGLVRSRPELGLRLQPRGSHRVLRQGAGARSRLRDGPLGHRLRGRAELQPALAPLRSGGQGQSARRRLRRHAGGAGLPRSGDAGRAGADPGAAGALSAARADRGPVGVGRGLHRSHAHACSSAYRDDLEVAQRLRRSDHERDALADVGSRHRRRCRGRRHRGGGRGAGRGSSTTSPRRGTIPACCISMSI